MLRHEDAKMISRNRKVARENRSFKNKICLSICGLRSAKESPSEPRFVWELGEGEVLESAEGNADRVCLRVAGTWNAPDGDDSGAL